MVEKVNLLMALVLAFLMPGTALCESRIDLRPNHVDINLFAGMEKLSSSDWKPLDQHFKTGLEITYLPLDLPVALTGAAFHSNESGNEQGFDVEATIHEFHLGVKRYIPIWSIPEFQPSYGGGLAFASYETEVEATSSTDGTGVGLWIGTTALYSISDYFNIGAMARYSYIPVDKGDETINAGGLFGGLTIGYRWKDRWYE